MLRFAVVILIGLSSLTGLAAGSRAGEVSVIPRPVSVERVDGVFRLTAETRIVARGPAWAEAAKLIDALAPATGFVLRGASPRAGQAMILGAKALAAVAGRTEVSKDDIHRLALPALRHRISLNFEGHAEEAGIDGIIQDILNAVQK